MEHSRQPRFLPPSVRRDWNGRRRLQSGRGSGSGDHELRRAKRHNPAWKRRWDLYPRGPSVTTGFNPSGIAAGDFNADGATDLVVCNQASAALTLLLGNGDGTFAVSPYLSLPEAYRSRLQSRTLTAMAGLISLADIGTSVVRIMTDRGVGTVSNTGIVVPGGGTHQIKATYTNMSGAPYHRAVRTRLLWRRLRFRPQRCWWNRLRWCPPGRRWR